jgi:ribosomal protein L37E
MRRDVTVERVEDEFAGTFECASCGFETAASVRSWANAAVSARTEGATQAARAIATEDAGAIASRTLMFVRCPSCGKRDPRARTYQIQIVLAALGMGAAGFAILFVAIFKLGLDRTLGPLAPALAAACGLVWAARTYLKYRRAWTRVDDRVVLGTAAAPPG